MQVKTVAWVQTLARELPHASGEAKKKKKKDAFSVGAKSSSRDENWFFRGKKTS